MDNLILVGGGGHCKSVLDSLKDNEKYKVVGIIDVKEKVGSIINGIKVIGTDEELEEIFKSGIINAFITVGYIKINRLRQNIYDKLKNIGYKFPIIIDSSAIIASNVIVGEGTFIGKRAIVNSCSNIGKNCIINSGAIIEHDCIIREFSHIAPGATLSGGVSVGKNTLIGTNTTIIQAIAIGDDTLIGAGSVVIRNIGSKRCAYGNPCKEITRYE